MRKSDCKLGMKVFVRGCPSYRATVRAMHAEDVHLEWSQAAIDHQARNHDRPLPLSVGYADVTEVLETPVADEAAPDAGSSLIEASMDWSWLWKQLEKILDDRRQIAKDLRAALPLANAKAIDTDTIISLPSNLVEDFGLIELRRRTVEIHERLDSLKQEASAFLERTYNDLLL